MDGKKVEEFELGEPALVCRWRLAGGKLPLENRHLRALSRRVVLGRAVTPQLVGWAKQHIEWTLQDGSAQNPDGVLMLVMDAEGRAAMTVGPYAPLAPEGEATAELLAGRAVQAAREEAEAGVAPEVLWAVTCENGAARLVCGAREDAPAAGTSSLVADLAQAFGIEVAHDPELAHRVLGGEAFDEVLLASDEHGVVAAADACGDVAARLAAGYQKLLDSTRAR